VDVNGRGTPLYPTTEREFAGPISSAVVVLTLAHAHRKFVSLAEEDTRLFFPEHCSPKRKKKRKGRGGTRSAEKFETSNERRFGAVSHSHHNDRHLAASSRPTASSVVASFSPTSEGRWILGVINGVPLARLRLAPVHSLAGPTRPSLSPCVRMAFLAPAACPTGHHLRFLAERPSFLVPARDVPDVAINSTAKRKKVGRTKIFVRSFARPTLCSRVSSSARSLVRSSTSRENEGLRYRQRGS